MTRTWLRNVRRSMSGGHPSHPVVDPHGPPTGADRAMPGRVPCHHDRRKEEPDPREKVPLLRDPLGVRIPSEEDET